MKEDVFIERYSILLKIADLLSTANILEDGLKALNTLLTIEEEGKEKSYISFEKWTNSMAFQFSVILI